MSCGPAWAGCCLLWSGGRRTELGFGGRAVIAWQESQMPGVSYSLSGIRYMAASDQMQWANAAGKLAMGVHGIEQFNFFCTDQVKVPGLRSHYSSLKDNDKLEAMRNKPKHYCLESPSGRMSNDWELPEPVPTGGPERSAGVSALHVPGARRPHLTVQLVIPHAR